MANVFEKEVPENVSFDLSLCIICQKVKEESLVDKPSSHEKVVKFIDEWCRYGDLRYSEAWSKLKSISLNDLIEKQASWHRSCYRDAVHTGMLKRAKDRYERQLAGPNESRRKSTDATEETSKLTRSKTFPYDKNVCFFCEGHANYKQSLHSVTTFSAGESLRAAIELSGNDKLRVKLSTAIDDSDAHAIDIKYHKNCWLYNISNVLRKPSSSSAESTSSVVGEIAAKIEFLAMTEMALMESQILTMSELQDAFEGILQENNVSYPKCSRKALKQLLQREIPEVEFHKPKRVNEAERVSIKKTRDAAIQLTETVNTDCTEEMKIVYDAAAILRKSINKCKKWVFTGSLQDVCSDNIPNELLSFFRWVIQGPKTDLSAKEKSEDVIKRAMSLSQTTVSMCLTERQRNNKKSESLKSTREMPQQLAVGLAVHQATRSKALVTMLHGFGMSIEYNRLLRVEAQIESSLIQRMEQNNGVYIPPNVVIGRHVFFAVDNVDFAEDTYDGQRTLHGTAMAIYQKGEPGDSELELRIDNTRNQSRSITDIPESITTLLQCPKSCPKPTSPVYRSFGLRTEDDLPNTVNLQDYAWLLARHFTRSPLRQVSQDETAIEEQSSQSITSLAEEQPDISTHIPVWSGYNSLINNKLQVTRVGSPPLIAAPAHEWNTLLTILKQAQNINTRVVGPERKTIISLDVGLYQPAKKLQMARHDLNHLILRPGELHIVMAQLRTIGAFIEDSGLDMCWIESDLYGPATVTQILKGKHIKRAETAHIITLQALFSMYQDAFFQSFPDDSKIVGDMSKQVADACSTGTEEEVQNANTRLMRVVKNQRIIEKMAEFDAAREKHPMFKVTRQYMRMVMEMLKFIRAVRTGNWELHLEALEIFAKYFFSHDRLNYARMIPLYLAEMKSLEASDPDIYAEFLQGNWVVNKNANVSFCAIGADHGLEHVNRSMKVAGGLVGITLNPNARTKFFFIAPELARLAEAAKDMAGVTSKILKRHHNLTTSVLSREEKNIQKLLATVESFTNPFLEESTELFNIVTKVVMPEKVKEDLCSQSESGQILLNTFVEERIRSGKINLWAPMKKRKLLTWKSNAKVVKVSTKEQLVELKEDRSLFARMMMVCRSRPEIDLKETVGVYEFSLVPRSLFAADGSMLYCSSKSALMAVLEEVDGGRNSQNNEENVARTENVTPQMVVTIVDGMAELQSLDKPVWIKNCSQLADHFNKRIDQKYVQSREVRLIFDRYDLPMSLKAATRIKRQGGQDPVYYRITDSTHIAKVSLKRLLSHTRTKMELTVYLAEKTLQHAGRQSDKRLVVAWGSECKATHQDVTHLQSSQEEADTKMLLHAVDATSNGATEIHIHSPDTDVLVLSLRRYPDLCENVSFVTGKGQNRRVIKLGPIVQTLGQAKIAALPAFHAISGADNTGSFSGKGKLSCWKIFQDADEDIITELGKLGTNTTPTVETMAAIEKFVCQLYCPKTNLTKVKELRWWLFRKKQAQSERLPPTQAALHEAILRAHYQVMIWNSDIISNPELPSPENYGWQRKDNEWLPFMTQLPPAPEAVIQLVKCNCIKERCSSNRCQCRKAGLNCTDLCTCSMNDEEDCNNAFEQGYCEEQDEEDSDDETV